MSDSPSAPPSAEPAPDPEEAETSIELEDDDGNPFRISQQNVGPGNQVGQGEFKPVTEERDPGDAAAEQNALEREAPAPRP